MSMGKIIAGMKTAGDHVSTAAKKTVKSDGFYISLMVVGGVVAVGSAVAAYFAANGAFEGVHKWLDKINDLGGVGHGQSIVAGAVGAAGVAMFVGGAAGLIIKRQIEKNDERKLESDRKAFEERLQKVSPEEADAMKRAQKFAEQANIEVEDFEAGQGVDQRDVKPTRSETQVLNALRQERLKEKKEAKDKEKEDNLRAAEEALEAQKKSTLNNNRENAKKTAEKKRQAEEKARQARINSVPNAGQSMVTNPRYRKGSPKSKDE